MTVRFDWIVLIKRPSSCCKTNHFAFHTSVFQHCLITADSPSTTISTLRPLVAYFPLSHPSLFVSPLMMLLHLPLPSASHCISAHLALSDIFDHHLLKSPGVLYTILCL